MEKSRNAANLCRNGLRTAVIVARLDAEPPGWIQRIAILFFGGDGPAPRALNQPLERRSNGPLVCAFRGPFGFLGWGSMNPIALVTGA